MMEAFSVGCGMKLIGVWGRTIGGSLLLTRFRSYQLSFVDCQGLRTNLISSGQKMGGVSCTR